jgi:hypothetical protein
MGTVTVYSSVAVTNVNYKPINDALQFAYKRQTHNPSGVGSGTTLKIVCKHAKEFLKHLKDTYDVPPHTDDNDAIVLYLQALSHWFEETQQANFPGNPDPQVFAAMANANHQSCLVYLDSILQGLYAYNHHQFDPDARPTYSVGKTETDYFVAYVDALGNVPN